MLPVVLFLATGCGDASDPAAGEGTVSFTTWGEEYVEQEIPVQDGDRTGFSDGWTVRYQKFLIALGGIRVASQTGEVAYRWEGSKVFDNHVAGVKAVVETPAIAAKAWDEVGYEVAPPDEATQLSDGVSEEDVAMMRANGMSLYVEGSARKAGEEKHFSWGFALATRYRSCHSEQGGKDELGLVVKNNSRIDAQLTTHGDHLFYDRLQESEGQVTALRFDALAEADQDADGEITLEELDANTLDVTRYNRSGLDATTHGDFVRELARTVGHFRGEGECSVSAL